MTRPPARSSLPARRARLSLPARLGRRAAATAVDYALVSVPLALLGLLQVRRGRAGRPIGGARARVAVALALTVPVTCGLAAAEATGGSPGKRLLGLQVRGRDGRSSPYAAALLRTALKTAIPWELAHQGVWDVQDEAGRKRGETLLACAYAALAAQAVMICTPSGRTYPDLLAGTVVGRRDRRGADQD
ncbi:RDD family protein [Sphaerisporangium sp. NPDC051011]|uniref:RDD family protein n=1 Tax=Sphaerisporangium sp. NPDC051011 TaxID=3155792 RepID=UPI0033F7D811